MTTAVTSVGRAATRPAARRPPPDLRVALAQIATLAPFVCRTCGAGAMTAGRCGQDDGELRARGGEALLGTRLGPYRLARRIGAGGMGTVYQAQHVALRTAVAVKVMHDGDALDRARFSAEVRAANLLAHRNIAPVLDVGDLPDGRPYYVMPLLTGATLDATFRFGRPRASELADWFGQLLAAVSAAHAMRIVHRDLKPSNVFIGDDGVVRLLDFGVAKLAPSLGGVTSLYGSVVGTPAYMAPEQTCGLPVDGRADLYSVGVMLYEALVGALPFAAPDRGGDRWPQRTQAAPCVRALRPDVSPALAAVVARALATDPSARFGSAAAFAAALAAACSTTTRVAAFAEHTAAWTPSPRHAAPLPPAPARLADGTGPIRRNELRTIVERPAPPRHAARRWLGLGIGAAAIAAALAATAIG
jgi:serine/threonine protein kinase